MVQAPKHNIFNLHVLIVSAVSVEWIIVIGGDVVPRQVERRGRKSEVKLETRAHKH